MYFSLSRIIVSFDVLSIQFFCPLLGNSLRVRSFAMQSSIIRILSNITEWSTIFFFFHFISKTRVICVQNCHKYCHRWVADGSTSTSRQEKRFFKFWDERKKKSQCISLNSNTLLRCDCSRQWPSWMLTRMCILYYDCKRNRGGRKTRRIVGYQKSKWPGLCQPSVWVELD